MLAREASWLERRNDETHELAGRQHGHAKHEVSEDLVVTANAHIAAAELILEPPIEPLGRRAFVAKLLNEASVLRAFFSSFNVLQFDRSAGVHVDDRLVAQRYAVRPDLDGIIGRVHKVIQILDPPGRQGSQWDAAWESCVDAEVTFDTRPPGSHAWTPRS